MPKIWEAEGKQDDGFVADFLMKTLMAKWSASTMCNLTLPQTVKVRPIMCRTTHTLINENSHLVRCGTMPYSGA